MKTIALQLNIKDFPFIIKDKNGNEIYREDSDGFWYKSDFDEKGNETFLEDPTGYWCKKEYDENSNITYYENSDGYWYIKEYDQRGNAIYFETSDGYIKDNRPKPKPEYTMEQLVKMLGEDFKLVK